MSYLDYEESAQDGTPVLLYEFIQGATTWRFCSISEDISRSGSLWSPLAILPGKFVASQDDPRAAITIKIPRTCALAMSFLGVVTDSETTVTIFRTHYSDPDQEVVTYWSGVVAATPVDGNVMELSCESLLSTIHQQGLQIPYSRTCPYGFGTVGRCNVDTEALEVEALATACAGSAVTVPDAAEMDDLTWGTLRAPDGSERMILTHSGATLTLMWPIRTLPSAIAGTPGGAPVILTPGCDHSFTMCRDRYNNAGCYGGEMGIPAQNPMAAILPILE